MDFFDFNKDGKLDTFESLKKNYVFKKISENTEEHKAKMSYTPPENTHVSSTSVSKDQNKPTLELTKFAVFLICSGIALILSSIICCASEYRAYNRAYISIYIYGCSGIFSSFGVMCMFLKDRLDGKKKRSILISFIIGSVSAIMMYGFMISCSSFRNVKFIVMISGIMLGAVLIYMVLKVYKRNYRVYKIGGTIVEIDIEKEKKEDEK